MIFYTALHAIDSLLKHDDVKGVVSHNARNATLIKTNRYAQIWRHFQPLYDLSRTVRYLAKPGRWVSWDKIEVDVVKRYLYPIEKSVQKLIGKNIVGTLTLLPKADSTSSPG